jgi:hypothetical protein
MIGSTSADAKNLSWQRGHASNKSSGIWNSKTHGSIGRLLLL